MQAARKLVDSDGASCIAGAWALGGHDPERRVGVDPRGGPADLAGVDERRDHRPRRRRPRQPDLAARLVPGPDPRRLRSTRSSAAPRARRSTSAPATTPTAPASPRRSRDAWEGLGGTIGEEVIYDPELPSYDSEAEQIRPGNPDAIVIIDFPETYQQGRARRSCGPGTSTRRPRSSPTGSRPATCPRMPAQRRPTGCAAPRRARPTTTSRRRRSTRLYTRLEPTDVERQTFDAQNFDAVILCYLAAVAAGSTEGADMARAVQDSQRAPG